MDPINYATLEQSKRMKELSYLQDKTDCVWICFEGSATYQLEPRDKFTPDTYRRSSAAKWYAAPNAQEIELSVISNIHFTDLKTLELVTFGTTLKDFGESHHAQTRANTFIWKKENIK